MRKLVTRFSPKLSTLRFRLALWITVLLLVLLIIFGTFVYINLARTLHSTMDDTLRVSATQAMATIDTTAWIDLHEQGLTIRFFSQQGDLVQAEGTLSDLPIDAAAIADALRGHMRFSTVIPPGDDDPVRVFTAPAIQTGQTVGVIQVVQSLGKINDTLEQLFTTLLIGVPLLSILAGGSGYLLAAYALDRVEKITHAVQHISAEDLSTRLNLSPHNDEVGRLATTFDEMLARLDDSFERERRFTADASHELRTPLAAIQIILGTMLEKRRSPEEYEQAMLDISEEANRLGTLAENLLALARRDEPQRLANERVDLTTMLQDVTESLLPLAEAKGLSLCCEITEPLALQGDTDELLRLFVNLLDNAIKYTDEGKITVKAKRESSSNTLAVIVTDTGIGIAEDHLPHIFEPFFRVDASRTTRGSGLGLTIAQEIAQAHGGIISVTSSVGSGSTFTVSLCSLL